MEGKYRDNDSNIIEACINGDLAAWGQLTRKYESLIYASIVNRLRKYGFALPRQDIEDIRQNVLTNIWKSRKLENVRNRGNIAYWLAIVSGNIAIGYMRNKRAKDMPNPAPIHCGAIEELAELAGPEGATVFDNMARDEMLKKIDEAIEALSFKEKLIIKLNFYHDKKYNEIADILNMPPGTVSSYIKRAKEKLKKNLKDF